MNKHEKYMRSELFRRQILIPEIGDVGQEKLSSARVLIVGLGGLGGVVAEYLMRAGIGHLGLLDCDTVHESNLNRQILYKESDVGRSKTALSIDHLRRIHSCSTLDIHTVRFDQNSSSAIIEPYDIIVDAVDNFPTKFLLNDSCVTNKKTLIHAGVTSFQGQIMTIEEGAACLRCLKNDVPSEKVGEKPIIGITAGCVGILQATEVIKAIVGVGDRLLNTVLFVDLLRFQFKKIFIEKQSSCPICRSA